MPPANSLEDLLKEKSEPTQRSKERPDQMYFESFRLGVWWLEGV